MEELPLAPHERRLRVYYIIHCIYKKLALYTCSWTVCDRAHYLPHGLYVVDHEHINHIFIENGCQKVTNT